MTNLYLRLRREKEIVPGLKMLTHSPLFFLIYIIVLFYDQWLVNYSFMWQPTTLKPSRHLL